MEILKLANETEVINNLCSQIEKYAKESIDESGQFRVGLSGGSLVKYLASGLPAITTSWSKWHLFFCDERFVPDSDADSTFGAYKKELISKVPLNESQFYKINTNLSLTDCAKEYESTIRKAFDLGENAIPAFDLLLLGMGPDGHTCSLFPGHQLLNDTLRLVAPISDSPKPPPQRVTMTYPLINNAKCCIFAMSGAGKAEMVKRILVDKEHLPAGLVKPKQGFVKWIVDNEAGKDLL